MASNWNELDRRLRGNGEARNTGSAQPNSGSGARLPANYKSVDWDNAKLGLTNVLPRVPASGPSATPGSSHLPLGTTTTNSWKSAQQAIVSDNPGIGGRTTFDR